MTECVVYWIKADHHDDILQEGYVGVSTNLDGRIYRHQRGYGNIIVERASQKYNLTVDVVFEGSVDECLSYESKLRPTENVGWNIAAGGGMPPPANGRKWTADQRAKYIRTVTENNSNARSVESREKQSITRKKLGLGWGAPPDLSNTKWWNDGSSNKRSPICPGRGWNEGRMKFNSYGQSKRCPYCNKVGKGSGMVRFHFENCKNRGE